MIERPDGIVIASVFIVAILIFSGLSRLWRATELRVTEARFVDERSAQLWRLIQGKKVHLVPLKTATPKRVRARPPNCAGIMRPRDRWHSCT